MEPPWRRSILQIMRCALLSSRASPTLCTYSVIVYDQGLGMKAACLLNYVGLPGLNNNPRLDAQCRILLEYEAECVAI